MGLQDAGVQIDRPVHCVEEEWVAVEFFASDRHAREPRGNFRRRDDRSVRSSRRSCILILNTVGQPKREVLRCAGVVVGPVGFGPAEEVTRGA